MTFLDAAALEKDWKTNPRWQGVKRPYKGADVVKLRGSLPIEYSIAKHTSEKLWNYFASEKYVNALGALTGNQAMQQVRAGLKAIYLSGWQVAADANLAGQMYPDQSLYPFDSVPSVVRRINATLKRADEIEVSETGKAARDWFQPIVADAEAGFGGNLNAFELQKMMIEAGAAGVHWEDQLSSAKKCGHMGGKVLVPIREHIEKLVAARLAADTCGVPSVIIARTDANGSYLVTSDVDERDSKFIKKGRTVEGFFNYDGGIDAAIARGIAFADHADLVWCETSTPDLAEAKKFAEAMHKVHPGKYLAYNCSPSFNWRKNLDDATIAKFQKELGAMGYKFQFITLAGFHALNHGMFDLATKYKEAGMAGYVTLQDKEFADAIKGFTAVKHQREVGVGYFDAVAEAISGGQASTTAFKGSTEEEQFH